MFKQREIVLITGKTGSGKSTLFRNLIGRHRRVLIIDTLSEYAALSPAFGALIVHSISDLILFLRANYKKSFKVVFDPQELSPETADKFFQIAYTLHQSVIGVEELAYYCRPNFAPEYLKRIVRFGRHKALSVYATTQRPNEIPTIIRAQVNRLISFKMHEPRDVAYLRQIVGDRADNLPTLGQYKFEDMPV